MKTTSILITCYLLTFSTITFAIETNWYICDSCSTFQKKSKAESNAPNDPLSYAYVLDLDNKTITKWTVTTEPGFRNAIQIAVDSTANSKFNEYKSVLLNAEMPFSVYPTESSSGFGSAFQLVGSPANLETLYTWFELNEFDAFDWDTSYFGSIIATMRWRIFSEFDQAVFYFDNGSMLRVNTVDWDWVNADLRFEYAYAEDENSEEIPLDPSDYQPDDDDGVDHFLGDYLDNNRYSAVDVDGDPYGMILANRNKVVVCDRASRFCTIIPR
jgi:hypothetical protein